MGLPPQETPPTQTHPTDKSLTPLESPQSQNRPPVSALPHLGIPRTQSHPSVLSILLQKSPPTQTHPPTSFLPPQENPPQPPQNHSTASNPDLVEGDQTPATAPQASVVANRVLFEDSSSSPKTWDKMEGIVTLFALLFGVPMVGMYSFWNGLLLLREVGFP